MNFAQLEEKLYISPISTLDWGKWGGWHYCHFSRRKRAHDVYYVLCWQGKSFSLLQNVRTGLWGPGASYSMRTGVLSRGYNGWCVILATHLHLTPRKEWVELHLYSLYTPWWRRRGPTLSLLFYGSLWIAKLLQISNILRIVVWIIVDKANNK